jgi:2-oxoisovalerate dehydrogenase E1 component
MYLIRTFEETVARLVRQGEVPGFVHLSMGQEASAVGVMAALGPADVVYSGHRAHGHLLARGADPLAVLAEILGRDEGIDGGRGGSMHLIDPGVGFWGATGVVGGTIPLALGTAWARRESGIAVVFFGDGASTSGIFHESLNLAALWSLPVLFCCENNGYAEFSARAEQSPVAYASRFAEPYGIATARVDGTELRAVMRQAQAAVQVVRQGRPFFLELEVVRLAGHYEGDVQTYRSAEEQEQARSKDPVWRERQVLLNAGILEEEIAQVEEEVKRQMRAAEDQALAMQWPESAAG